MATKSTPAINAARRNLNRAEAELDALLEAHHAGYATRYDAIMAEPGNAALAEARANVDAARDDLVAAWDAAS